VPEWLKPYARPREGWLALGLLFVMLLSLAWSIQRAEWIEQLDFLVPVAFWAILLGAAFGVSRLSVVGVLPISALVGGGIVLWAVGGEYFPDLSQAERLLVLRGNTLDWTRIVVDRGYAPQLTPYALGLGILMWVTSFIAAYTIYRHHRVLDAILLVGAALIANMSATFTDLFGYLVLFMLAALLLWLRAALIGRQEGWQRRRVNENAEVPAAIMRSGVLFIAGSIAMAWILTTVAVAAPLTAVWNNLDGAWTEVRDRFEGVFGGLSNADSRITGASFGPSFRISGRWVSRDDPVLTVAASGRYYLGTRSHDQYTGHGFAQSDWREREVEAGQPIFPGYTPERPTNTDAFTSETITIQIQGSTGRNLFTPGYPLRAFAPLLVLESANQPFLGGLQATGSIPEGTGYAITAAISHATQAQLAAASSVYPPEIREFYMGTDGVTDRTRALAAEIVAEAGADNQYEKAEALADFLRNDASFRYAVSAPIPEDPNQDFVDFFLFDENGRIGYCEYYATAMAVMARSVGLPSRVVTGFAPGERLGPTETGEGSIFQVRERNAHAWAEIYFPGYGWQIFESTKSIAPVTRPAGEAVPSLPPGPGASLPPGFDEGFDEGIINSLPSFEPLPGGFEPGQAGPPEDSRGGNTLLILSIILVVLAFATWRWRRARRAFRFLAPGERQWRRLALAADRAGVAQRPAETIYEYASWLEEQIPRRSPEIRAIADGKVWQSYSGRGISSAMIARIEAAWKRLELPMLWLAVRRRVRSLMPGR
jgi:hypothetical protein